MCDRSIVSFFFNDTATTEIYTLSLHDALPISPNEKPANTMGSPNSRLSQARAARTSSTSPLPWSCSPWLKPGRARSEEHTSELQSRFDLVCRLLLERKKTTKR